MREIKFKIWDLENQRWDRNQEDITIPVGRMTKDADQHGWILCQFTGLKDKNGKDVFEGDIVRLAGYGMYKVEFPFIQLYESYQEDDVEEILGNIYENPELLKDN